MKMAKRICFMASSLQIDIDMDVSSYVWDRCRSMLTNQIRQDYIRAMEMGGPQARMGLPIKWTT